MGESILHLKFVFEYEWNVYSRWWLRQLFIFDGYSSVKSWWREFGCWLFLNDYQLWVFMKIFKNWVFCSGKKCIIEYFSGFYVKTIEIRLLEGWITFWSQKTRKRRNKNKKFIVISSPKDHLELVERSRIASSETQNETLALFTYVNHQQLVPFYHLCYVLLSQKSIKAFWV